MMLSLSGETLVLTQVVCLLMNVHLAPNLTQMLHMVSPNLMTFQNIA
jgi:hypothetical protein